MPVFSPPPALAISSLLKKTIIQYNLRALNTSLTDNSYRGEEGVLRLRPEVGKSFGMKVIIDQDYLDSKKLFKKADKFLDRARKAMASQAKEKFSGEHAQKIASQFLQFKNSVASAENKLISYRSRLKPDVDDRLNKDSSTRVMDRLLEESLMRTENKLRDALGYFYNVCQGENRKNSHLTPENVHFVNRVFQVVISQAPEKVIRGFDLDRVYAHKKADTYSNGKKVVEKRGYQYIPLLETSLKKFGNKRYRVDPLLFIALMKRESNFDPLAVSPAGAAGLTQIIPKTAKEVGMKNIYVPEYFCNARSLQARERTAKREAMAALFKINEKNKLQNARRARKLMQKSLILQQKKKRLLARYKKDLLRTRTDDRLNPALSIEYGLKYFAGLMKDHKGDISLALASYNAGPHRVREFKGIPPYEETVHFRNRVMKYYRDYLRKAEEAL